ncbi:MAG: DMT family transporter [Rhodoferax sp.]|nr:DMT family transporter [Rhodoferax sp.]
MQSKQLDVRGACLVLGSATVWSFGGAIARYLTVSDSWTVVFWRSVFASAFLLAFMLWQHGRQGTQRLFRAMGWAGVGVGLCFATASTCFVVALSYTTVANVLLLQAGVPLMAALMAFLLFREHVPRATWIAIAAVIGGVAVMVSESLGGNVSPIGDGLALMVALAFAAATVITRRHAHVAMMPAVCLGTLIAACVSGAMTQGFAVSAVDAMLLFAFGALNLGLGLALFVTGVRLLPSAMAALIGIAEPVLGPLWVWLVHNEVPSQRTLLGGTVVFLALLAHIAWQLRQQRADSSAG